MSKTYFKIHSAAKVGRQTNMDMLFAMVRSLTSPQEYLTLPLTLDIDISMARQNVKEFLSADHSNLLDLEKKEAEENFQYMDRHIVTAEAFLMDWIDMRFPGWEDMRGRVPELNRLAWSFLSNGINFSFVIGEAGYHFAFLPNDFLNESANRVIEDLEVMTPYVPTRKVDLENVPQS